MSENEPKIKHQKCKICDFVTEFEGIYWCWNQDTSNPVEVEPTDSCYKWHWNGVDEK